MGIGAPIPRARHDPAPLRCAGALRPLSAVAYSTERLCCGMLSCAGRVHSSETRRQRRAFLEEGDGSAALQARLGRDQVQWSRLSSWASWSYRSLRRRAGKQTLPRSLRARCRWLRLLVNLSNVCKDRLAEARIRPIRDLENALQELAEASHNLSWSRSPGPCVGIRLPGKTRIRYASSDRVELRSGDVPSKPSNHT